MKRNLKNDGQQFHTYQQNQQSLLILTHRTQNDHDNMTLEIQVLTWDRQPNFAGLIL